MNISKFEQRTLHILAKGGFIEFNRLANGKVDFVRCFTREGFVLVDCTLSIFHSLKRKRLISSRAGMPYRISQNGLYAVRAQLDNQ
jgi:uncharacterized protein